MQKVLMSLASLLNDTARIYSISTSHDNLGGIVNTSSFVAAVPCRRWKRSLGAGEIAGQDNVRREYRVAFNPSTTARNPALPAHIRVTFLLL